MSNNWDIFAEVHFLPTAEGGRRGPTPDTELRCIMTIDHMNFDVRVYFGATGSVFPGQTVRVPIRFLNPSTALQYCYKDRKFYLRELGIIAEGTVIDVSPANAATG